MICTATTAKGQPCKAAPLDNQDICVAHAGRNGRPTKLTDRLADEIVDHIQHGAYAEIAARACGIDESTFYRWLETGEADQEHGRDTPHASFRKGVKRAEADAEVCAIRYVFACGDSWQARMTYLERKFPKRWGRRERHEVEHSGAIGKPEPVEVPDDDAWHRQVADVLEEAGAVDAGRNGHP